MSNRTSFRYSITYFVMFVNINFEICMCQAKVGKHLQNRHNEQNQIEKSDKGLKRERLLSHLNEGETETFPENS